MPEIQLTPNTFADDYLKPFVSAVEDNWDTDNDPLAEVARAAFVSVADALIDAFGNLPFPDTPLTVSFPNPFPAPDPDGGGDAPLLPVPPAGLAPIDPIKVLKAIASAIRDAENILNEANLALGSAAAEVKVVVDVGGVAGANATLTLNLAPTPRG